MSYWLLAALVVLAVILGGCQSSAPLAVASGAYERFRRVNLQVTAPAHYAERPVQVWDGETLVGEGTLQVDGQLAKGKLTLPMPTRPSGYGPLTISSGGKAIAHVELGDLSKARQKALEDAPLTMNNGVVLGRKAIQDAPLEINNGTFMGKTFPKPEFEDPSFLEDVVGPYEFRTTYYDADYNVVDTPIRMGRYGAIVEVIPTYGEPIRRCFTLFRYQAKTNWHDSKLSGSFSLPPELGIDPVVVQKQRRQMSEWLQRALWTSIERSQYAAIVLAGLSEMSASDAELPTRLSVRVRDENWWFGLRTKLGMETPYRFLLQMPKRATSAAQTPKGSSAKWPLLIFLHGAGDRGEDIERVSSAGPLLEIASGRDLPFIVLAPQCPFGEWWKVNKLEEMLKTVLAQHPEIDTSRIYLTGLSMGGFGSWEWATIHPERFAAVVPICGGGDPMDAERLKETPIWVFHGGRDNVIWPEESYDMVAALREVHGRVRLTLYPEADHDSFTQTYKKPELYEWMLAQRLHEPTQERSTAVGTQPSN